MGYFLNGVAGLWSGIRLRKFLSNQHRHHPLPCLGERTYSV